MQNNFIYQWLSSWAGGATGLPDWLLIALSVLGSIAVIGAATPLVSLLVQRIIHHTIKRRVRAKEKAGKQEDVPKLRTIETILRSFIKYVIYFFAIVALLSALGMGGVVASLVTAAGVGGLAITFGAQSLVKDIITGLFMAFENQFSVGDYVIIEGIEGTVESMQIRITQIRGLSGELNSIPNGSIVHVVNHSRGNSVAVVYVDVDFEQDMDAAMRSAQAACDRLAKTDASVLHPPVIRGVESATGSSITLRITCEVKPAAQWDVQRKLRVCIQEQFRRDGIYPPIQRSEFVHARQQKRQNQQAEETE